MKVITIILTQFGAFSLFHSLFLLHYIISIQLLILLTISSYSTQMTNKRMKEHDLKEAEMALIATSHSLSTGALKGVVQSMRQENIELSNQRDLQSQELNRLITQVHICFCID